MQIKAIKHTEKEVHVQIQRTNNYTRILTEIARLLKIENQFHFEEEFHILGANAESYTSASSKKGQMQVVVSRHRVHIIVKAALATRRKVLRIIEQASSSQTTSRL